MRQETIYKIRLLLLADCLERIKKEPKPEIHEAFLEWPLHNLHVYYHIKYNVRLFDCLLTDFGNHWYYNEDFDEPQLKSFPDCGFSWAFIFFFGLKNPKRFIHLFDCQGTNQNIEKWGGVHIIETSFSSDIAFNIREYLAKKE